MNNVSVLGHFARRNAFLRPERKCIISGDTVLTFRQFNDRVNRLANSLAGLGVKKGDRVAYMNFNSNHCLEVKYALGKIGAVEVPLNIRLIGEEIAYIVNDSRAKVFLVGEGFQGIVEKIRSQLPLVEIYMAVGGGDNMLDWEKELAKASDSEPQADIDENDIVIQMYSSGTTGKPKGCMLTHRNIIEACNVFVYEWGINEDDILVGAQPAFHIATADVLFACIYAGATIVIQRSFEVEDFLKNIQRYKATFSGLLPQAARRVLFDPKIKDYDLSSIRFFITAYEPDLILKAYEIFACPICEWYGSTETTGIISFHNHFRSKYDKTSSCGVTAPNVAVKIVDENGSPLEIGQVGEIVVKGSTNMKGYWNRPEETAEAIRNGWLHTGDMGKFDADGYLYIVDRKKDMIRSGGENIYCKEVEDVLYKHPAILEAAVIGVPDANWGETVKAVVALKQGAAATESDIVEFCKKHLASYKKPTSVDFVSSLPRTSTGKVFKKDIKERYWKGYERRIN